MPKTKELQVVPHEAKNSIVLYDAAQEKIKAIDEQIKKLKKSKDEIFKLVDKGKEQLKLVHDQIGDFKVGDYKISLSTSTSIVIYDEDELPEECFQEVKTVVKAKVKELIIEGYIDKSVAEQVVSKNLSIK
jgi:predicted transport protein